MLRLLDRFEEILVATLIALATLLIFLSVTPRFAIGFAADRVAYARLGEMETLAAFAKSLFKTINGLKMTWVQGACIYLFIWMAKFGADYGERTCGVDILSERLEGAARRSFTANAMSGVVIFTAILTWIVDLGLGKVGFLQIVNLMRLLNGMVMEPSAIVLIMAPILYTIAMALGVDPVHFWIMLVVTMETGLRTPPVGLNLYVASSLSGLGLTKAARETRPWLLTMLLFLMLVTYIPEITLLLPRLLGM